jgi:four helix bundle protein
MPYHRLDVYQKSYQAALDVHKASLNFPKIEQYGLAQQLRGSSKSIPANIAEGMGKQDSQADVRRFIKIAIGSCDETRVWLEFARDLGYMSADVQRQFDERYQEVGRMLQGVVKRYEDKAHRGSSSL